MQTTLNRIRTHPLRNLDWQKLLGALGKTQADDAPLHLRAILDVIGLDGALWCFRAVAGEARVMRLYAVWCARQVQHLMRDPRSVVALDVAERFANDMAGEEELAAASDAAADYASNLADYAASDAAAATYAASDYAAGAAAYTAYGAAAAAAAASDYAAGAAAYTAYGAAAAAARAKSRAEQETELRRVLDCMDAGQDPYPR